MLKGVTENLFYCVDNRYTKLHYKNRMKKMKERISERINEWRNKINNEWRRERISEWWNKQNKFFKNEVRKEKWISERMKEGMNNEWKNKARNEERIKKWKQEWLNEWIYGRMTEVRKNEWMFRSNKKNEWINKKTNVKKEITETWQRKKEGRKRDDILICSVECIFFCRDSVTFYTEREGKNKRRERVAPIFQMSVTCLPLYLQTQYSTYRVFVFFLPSFKPRPLTAIMKS